MKQVLLFPMNVQITESNIPKSIAVNTKSDNAVLQKASDNGRLRCHGCLGKMHVVRSPAVYGPVNHFAHSVDADPDCVFRVNWNYPPDDETPPTSHKGEDPGKMVERLLLRALQRNLGDRPNTAIRSIPQRLPMIEIDGLAQSVEILSLSPGDAELWAKPFSGRREDRETIFFIAGWDISSPSLEKVFPNLMSKRPCIVIWPARPERPETLFALTSIQSKSNLCQHPIEEVDIGWVDYQKLLGVELDGTILFLHKPYRIALEHLEKAIEAEPQESPLRTLFQLMAKILLVDGAAIHKSVFNEDYDIARKPYGACEFFPMSNQLLKIDDFAFLIQRIPEVFEACQNTILLDTAKGFFTGFLKNIESELREARNETISLKQNLLMSETKNVKSEQKLANLTNRNQELEDNLEAQHNENRELRKEIEKLEQYLQKSESKSTEIEQELGKRNKELESVKQNLLISDAKNAESEQKLANLTNRSQELEDNLKAQHSENRELRKEIEKLKNFEKAIRDNWFGRQALRLLDLT